MFHAPCPRLEWVWSLGKQGKQSGGWGRVLGQVRKPRLWKGSVGVGVRGRGTEEAGRQADAEA